MRITECRPVPRMGFENNRSGRVVYTLKSREQSEGTGTSRDIVMALRLVSAISHIRVDLLQH